MRSEEFHVNFELSTSSLASSQSLSIPRMFCPCLVRVIVCKPAISQDLKPAIIILFDIKISWIFLWGVLFFTPKSKMIKLLTFEIAGIYCTYAKISKRAFLLFVSSFSKFLMNAVIYSSLGSRTLKIILGSLANSTILSSTIPTLILDFTTKL